MQRDPLLPQSDPRPASGEEDGAPAGRQWPSSREELLSLLRDGSELAGRLEARPAEEVRGLVERLRTLALHQEVRFASMLEIGSALSSVSNLDELLDIIVEKTTDLMEAERSTLFLVDEQTDELWSKVMQGMVNTEIRLKKGQGVAGWVAKTGKSINIRDAYNDPRFNPEIDQNTGFQTRSMLCQPIRNPNGDIIGVIQVLNRREGHFTGEDENLLSAIASQAAIAVENSKLYLSAIEQNLELTEIRDKLEKKVAELDLLYHIERLVSQVGSVETLFETVARKTVELVHSVAFTLTLRSDEPDDPHQFFALVDRGQWETHFDFVKRSLERDRGLGCRAMRSQRRLIYPEPRDDDSASIDAEILEEAGSLLSIPVENAVAFPLFDEEECIGAIELFNIITPPDASDAVTRDDLKVLSIIASRLAGALAEQRRREEEQKQERLATIGQMLSGVLHDFKNPMTIISGYVQLMAKTDDADARREYAESIVHQFEQLNNMTRELLMFARGDTNLLLRKTMIAEFMAEMRELLEPELEGRSVELDIELDYRGVARLDQVKFKRAILNLARNAADAMPDGGTFSIRVRRDDDELVFRFSDTGEGIPPEIRDTLFESFVTRGKANGTGLGLAIVDKIVEDHGGSIDFETDPERGTTFTIRIPFLEED